MKKKIAYLLCAVMLFTLIGGLVPATTVHASVRCSNGVSVNGWLHVDGSKLKNSKNETISLHGMSTHGLMWFQNLYGQEGADAVANSGANLFRVAMYTDEYAGYCNSAQDAMNAKTQLYKTVDAAIADDMYVIIDWHVLNGTGGAFHNDQAIDFFDEVSKHYANTPNVLYEICNEPNNGAGNNSWSGKIKPYAASVIPVIRKNSPKSIVIVGTPTWSQEVDTATEDPLNYDNIMYSLHFYSGTHYDWLRDKARTAIKRNKAIFVTEFGTCDSSGNGGLNLSEAKTWLDFLDDNDISWANWSLANKNETASALKESANISDGIQDYELTDSGKFIFARLATYKNSQSGGTTTPVTEQDTPHEHTVVKDAAVAPTCDTAGKTEGSHCSTCGAVITAQTEIKATGHNWNEGTVTSQPTEWNEGTKTYTCLKCNKTKTESVPKTGHVEHVEKGQAATCTQDGYTDYIRCEFCWTILQERTVIKALGHDYDNGVITRQATENQEGIKTYTCTRCGQTKTESIPKLTHTHSIVTDKAIAATCTTDGKTEGSHCSTCGAIIKAQETVKATGHTAKAAADTAATCTKAGKTGEVRCATCNTVLVASKEIKALGHDYDNGVITKQPTENSTGIKTYTCKRCGDIKTETIVALPHVHTVVTDCAVAATCTTDGKTEGSHCSSCGEIIKAQATEKALGHSFDNGTITKKATAYEEGVKTYTCSRCGTTKTESIAKVQEYDAQVYRNNNPDLSRAFGDDWDRYYRHFVNYGKAEGRNAYYQVTNYWNGVDYSLVFNAEDYAAMNPDIANAYGKDVKKLLWHFVNYGMKEGRRANITFDVNYYKSHSADLVKLYGNATQRYYAHFMYYGVDENRQGSAEFSAQAYRNNYQDMNKAYGNNWRGYYTHFSKYGYKEGRIADRQVTNYWNGTDYSAVFDSEYYAIANPDLKRAFGDSTEKLLKHFVNYGMAEGRVASAEFDPAVYRSRYKDLDKAFGNNWVKYYRHYLFTGIAEGRTGK